MKKIMTMLILGAMSLGIVSAQPKQPAGIRVEIAEAETDHGEYSIFTYKDADETFGYYLSLGRVSDFIGADEVLGMQVKNIHEVTIWLGSTCDDALEALSSIMNLYDKDVKTTVEFQGRTATASDRLGEPTTTTCVVEKKPLFGKRLAFLFTSGNRTAYTYLSKSTVKELRMELKFDIKLHPKQHRKK